jgi:hypothetical protein
MAARHERDVHLQLSQKCRALRGDKPSAENDAALLELHDFPERHEVARAAQVEDVAKIRTGHLWTTGAAARGKQGFFKFHGLAGRKHSGALLQAELGHDGIHPEVDLHPRKPGGIVGEDFLDGGWLWAEHGGEEVGPANAGMRFRTSEHDASFFIQGADGLARCYSCGAGPDD